MNTDATDTTDATDILVLDDLFLDDEKAAPPRPAESARQTPAVVATRRKTLRIRPAMGCSWGTTETCPRNGQVTSLSVGGGFVKTKAEVSAGQILYINCWLPTERWLLLHGAVTYHLPKVGFGISFQDMTETDCEMLSRLLEFYGE